MSAAVSCPDVAVRPSIPDEQEPIRRQIPSQRNREVFTAVAMGKSHSQVATEFGLTQPRVTQIVRQVREWSMQVAGGELGEFNEVQRMRLAEETLRRQLDGWMRMAMGEWHKSCDVGIGRTTFLNAAMRLSQNLARLYGVDVSGKTARLLAEQQARAEAELRRARTAEKPLWEEERKNREASELTATEYAPTPLSETACDEPLAATEVPPQPSSPIKNSYGLLNSAGVSDVTQAIKERCAPATPAVCVPAAHKPIPKFLDKKVRKRLLALRRQEALAAVG
jgi:hypothetical protein